LKIIEGEIEGKEDSHGENSVSHIKNSKNRINFTSILRFCIKLCSAPTQ
jgi:hypothetical protein